MDVWDELDLLGPAFLEFDPQDGGAFQVLAITGDIDYRVSTEGDETWIEWSWKGDDDGSDTGGRGWAIREDGRLVGHFYIHRGDDSPFVAVAEVPRSIRKNPGR